MRILVVDDHQLFIDGVRHILERLDDQVVITEANRTQEAIEILESGREFDLILIDLSMPGIDGMSMLQRMHERGVWLPLVVISGEEDVRTIKSALDAGALGFIPKSHGSREMLAALTGILDGEIYLPPGIEKEMERLGSRQSRQESPVTRRQMDVLQLMAKGYSNKQIATSLFLTEHTVKAHVSALFSTLAANNRTECVQIAQRQGIL
jgi:DNA-binding NarL/FixJ family response regulator